MADYNGEGSNHKQELYLKDHFNRTAVLSIIYFNKLLQVVLLLCTHYCADMLMWVCFQMIEVPKRLCIIRREVPSGSILNHWPEGPLKTIEVVITLCSSQHCLELA